MPPISFTVSWISPRIFERWCIVVRVLEFFGNRAGVGLLPRLGDVTIAASEKRKNSERREMYCFTMSRAMVRHCEGLRRDDVLTFWYLSASCIFEV